MTERNDDIERMLVRMEERLLELRPATPRVFAYLVGDGHTHSEPVEVSPDKGEQQLTFKAIPAGAVITAVLLEDEYRRKLWQVAFDRIVTVSPGDTLVVNLNLEMGW